MSNQPPLPGLSLDRLQVEQLRFSCSTYRDLLWQAPPTPERNLELRKVQAFQGRLSTPAEGFQLSLTLAAEEKQSVAHMLSVLTRSYGAAPDSPQKLHILAMLTTFRRMLQATNTRILSSLSEEGKSHRLEREC